MNLVHHLIVAERLRELLQWPHAMRGPMLLGAIAPDAHTDAPGIDRQSTHRTNEEPIEAVISALRPEGCLETPAGRAFAVSAIGHLVADRMTRSNRYHLPPHAPGGFVAADETEGVPQRAIFEARGVSRILMRARVDCWLDPLTPDAIDRKRWEILGRYPLRDADGDVVVVEPLLTIVGLAAARTASAIHGSDQWSRLLR